MAITQGYQYVTSVGRSIGTTGNKPLTAEVTAAGGLTSSVYLIGIDDKYNDYPHSLRHSTVTNTSPDSRSFDLVSEFYLLIDSSNGTSFTIGEPVTQSLSGDNFTATVVGFEGVSGGSWLWKYGLKSNIDATGSALLTIKDCGPTYGTTAGISGPTSGTAGELGGPGGCGGAPRPIVGTNSSASWNVIGISERISPQHLGLQYMQSEIDALGSGDLTSVVYKGGAGNTLDLTKTITDMDELNDLIKANHSVYGTTHALSTLTVTVYDKDNVAKTIKATAGGTPDTGLSEFATLYYNFKNYDAVRGASIAKIRAAYTDIGKSAGKDSVFKVRNFYTDRN